MVAEGDKVVARLTLTGTQRGDLPGMPASGKSINISMIALTHFRDGRIVDFWANWDTLGMLQQLGAAPRPGEA